MKLPAEVKSLLIAFADRFPLPQGKPGAAHEEACRQWSIRFAEQAAFSFPKGVYGVKRADPTRPVSKDSLASNKGNRLVSWDLMAGAGTGSPSIPNDPEFHDIPDQVFVPVPPTDHLNGATPAPTPKPEPTPPHVCPVGVPKHSYRDHLSLANELDAAYRGETGRTVHPEPLAHWIWRYQFEGYTRDALIAEAIARGIAEA